MPRQLHSAPAAAAITFVLCVACFSFLVFVLLPASAAVSGSHSITISGPSVHILNITRGTFAILMLGYIAGIMAWIVLFTLRRDGMHRLNLLLSERRLRLRLR